MFDFLFSDKNAKKSPDPMRIARIVSPMMDDLVKDIFNQFGVRLLHESITYIVPAIWGATKDGELSDIQCQIHDQVAPIISRVVDILNIRTLTEEQRFAIEYFIRGMLIGRLTYMTEAAKNEIQARTGESVLSANLLEKTDTWGTA